MILEIGQLVPDFTLYDTAKNKFTLSEHKEGKMFYFSFFRWHLPVFVLKNSVPLETILASITMLMLLFLAFLQTLMPPLKNLRKWRTTILHY